MRNDASGYNPWWRNYNKRKSPYCECEVKKAMISIPEICSKCYKRLKNGKKKNVARRNKKELQTQG